jgi:hypothetical protein
VEINTFQCPKCRAILQISGALERGKIIRCTGCDFIFPAPVISADPSPLSEGEGTPSRSLDSVLEEPAPDQWIDWQPSMQVESAPPPAEPPPRPRQGFRPRRRAFPWVFLIISLFVGLASIGLLIVMIVALWPSAKSDKSAAGSSSPLPWQEFVSAEGRFRVLMPGTPKFEDSVVHTRLGSLPVKAYDVKSGEYEFSVFYGDLDSEELKDISPEEWIDAEQAIYIARANARLLAEKNLSLHGYFGKERRYELSVGWLVARRMYAVNRRIYTVNFSRKKQEAPEDVIARFFDSFQILDKSEEP